MLESLFNPENALMCFINKIIDLVVLSILWTLCSAPLVTMGAASAALYYALTKSVRCQRGHAAKEFWRAFKSNLKRGILFELVWAALAFMMLECVPADPVCGQGRPADRRGVLVLSDDLPV